MALGLPPSFFFVEFGLSGVDFRCNFDVYTHAAATFLVLHDAMSTDTCSTNLQSTELILQNSWGENWTLGWEIPVSPSPLYETLLHVVQPRYKPIDIIEDFYKRTLRGTLCNESDIHSSMICAYSVCTCNTYTKRLLCTCILEDTHLCCQPQNIVTDLLLLCIGTYRFCTYHIIIQNSKVIVNCM